MHDSLGDRMKKFYEDRSRIFFQRRTYTIIRIDGKAFHTYTRGLEKPFDSKLINDMDVTAYFLCSQIQGAKFAFVQSDEISILLTDFDSLTTEAWFDGNIQKIVSVSASLATAKFNSLRPDKMAFFDSRAFQISNGVEVENYFIWRQQDATRNSIQSAAQSVFSHRQLENKNVNELQAMLLESGINWNDYPVGCKRGRFINKYEENGKYFWGTIDPPIFTQEKEFLTSRIPIHYQEVILTKD